MTLSRLSHHCQTSPLSSTTTHISVLHGNKRSTLLVWIDPDSSLDRILLPKYSPAGSRIFAIALLVKKNNSLIYFKLVNISLLDQRIYYLIDIYIVSRTHSINMHFVQFMHFFQKIEKKWSYFNVVSYLIWKFELKKVLELV